MQKIQLSIPEPCHASWQNMTPKDQGRFCDSCAKIVIDFSKMTDVEVLNYFSNLKNEKVCGRVLPIQLEEPIAMPNQPKKKIFWYWNYLTLFFMFFTKSSVKAQTTKGEVVSLPVATQPPMKMGMVAVGVQVKHNAVIAGKITDKDGIGIPFAIVRIKGTQIGVTTDAYGVYSIKSNVINTVLEISSPGFKTAEFNTAGLKLYNFTLALDNTVPKFSQVIAVAGGISFRSLDDNRCISNNNATFVIKDGETGEPVAKAALMVKKFGVNKTDTFFTNKGGSYQIKKMDDGASYAVNISAAGYETKELVITRDEFKNKTIVKEILLTKTAAPVTLTLPEVIINSYPLHTVGKIQMTSEVIIKQMPETTIVKKIIDTIRLAISTNSIKIYPNPVQRGNTLNIALSLKQAGNYMIQVTDAAGKTVLHKQVNAMGKDGVEKLPVDERWGSGIYFVSIFDSKNKLVNKSSFIVQ